MPKNFYFVLLFDSSALEMFHENSDLDNLNYTPSFVFLITPAAYYCKTLSPKSVEVGRAIRRWSHVHGSRLRDQTDLYGSRPVDGTDDEYMALDLGTELTWNPEGGTELTNSARYHTRWAISHFTFSMHFMWERRDLVPSIVQAVQTYCHLSSAFSCLFMPVHSYRKGSFKS